MLEGPRRGRQNAPIERFWRVVLVSALDEELDRTDARFGVDVFWKAFSPTAPAIAWESPPSRWPIFTTVAKSEIERRGGE